MYQRKRKGHRYSIRLLILAVLLCLSTLLILPVSAKKSAAGELADGVGDAVSDVGDALSDAASELMSGENGTVNDGDGVIGNESDKTTDTGALDSESDTAATDAEESGMGWIAVLIALAVVAAIIVLIVVLVPKKKHE